MLSTNLAQTPFLDDNGKVARAWLIYFNALESLIDLTPSLFSGLNARPTVGDFAIVSDSTTNVWGAAVAGGGGNTVLTWFNGVHWTVLGI